MRRKQVLGALLLLAGLGLLEGCAHKVLGDTPYYKKGPNQVEPPDGDLKDGTLVWIIGSEGTYKHVIAVNGVNAYVWANALAPTVDWNDMFAPQQEEPPVPGAKKSKAAKEKPATTVFIPPDPKHSDEKTQKSDATTRKQN